MPKKLQDILPKGSTAVITTLNDTFDVLSENDEFSSMKEIIKKCCASKGEIFNRTAWDKWRLFKYFQFLTSKTTGLDIEKSIKDESDKPGKIYSSNTTLDLDSMIITMKAISAEFVDALRQKADVLKNAPRDTSKDIYVGDLMDGNSLYKKLQTDYEGKALVQMAVSKRWITTAELFLVTVLDDGRFRCVNSDNLRRNAVRMPTVGYGANCRNLYSLPVMEHSTEPVHAWVRLEKSDIFLECMRRIAWQFNQLLECSNKNSNAFKIVAAEPNAKNVATAVGGLWLHRLAFLLYQITEPSDVNATYIEETYNMKSKTMTVTSPRREWNLHLNADSQDVEFNLFDEAGDDSALDGGFAHPLSNVICNHGAPLNMLRFYFLGLCDGVINFGFGVQFKAVKVMDSESGPVIEHMYPGTYSHFNSEEENGNFTKKVNYPVAGLCSGLVGFTERLCYDAEIVNNDLDVKMRRGSDARIIMPDSSISKLTRMWPSEPPLLSTPNSVLIRAMVYNTSIRHAAGGSDLPYMLRNSTKIKVRTNDEGGITTDLQGNDIGNVSISQYAHTIDFYTKQVGDMLNGLKINSGYRAEFAYLVNGYVNPSVLTSGFAATTAAVSSTHLLTKAVKVALWKISQFDDACLKNAVRYCIREPIISVLQKVRACHFLKAADVVDYCFLNINGYLCAYNLCLLALNNTPKPKPKSRELLSNYLKYVQDYLSIFYTGSPRKESMGNGQYYYNAVYCSKYGQKLNRPFGIMHPWPDYLTNFYDKSQAYALLFKQMKESNYVLTHRYETNASRRRKNKIDSVLLHGSRRRNKVFICNHPDCKEKYFLCTDTLFYHFEVVEVTHATTYSSDNNVVEVTKEIAKHLIKSIRDTLPDEQKQVLDTVLEGKNIILSGDGGTGKSYLLRKILKCLLVVHDDWVLNDQSRRPIRVVGICSQQLQAQNISTWFITTHKFCEIQDLVFPNFPDMMDLIKHCREKLDKSAGLKQRLRDLEVLIIDEYGMIPYFHIVYLRTLVRVARGMEDEASNSAAHDSQFDSDDDDEALNNSRCYDIQWVFCGQVLQLPPIGDSSDKTGMTKTMALDPVVNDSAVPFFLTKQFRFSADKTLQDLVQRAKVGAFSNADVNMILDAKVFGSETQSFLTSSSIADRFKVVSLVYKKDQLRKAIKDRTQELKNVFKKERPYELHAGHAMRHGGAVGERIPVTIEDTDLFQRMFVTSTRALLGGYFQMEWRQRKITAEDDEDPFLEAELHVPPLLTVWIGMPVILVEKMREKELTLLNTNGQPVQPKQIRTITLARNTQCIVKYVHIDCPWEDQFVTVQVKLTTEAGVLRDYLLDLKRQEFSCNAKVNEKEKVSTCTVYRMQFPFKNGLCISWATIQGMTLPFVHIDLDYNAHIYSYYDFPSLWYVTLGRVTSLKGLLFKGLPNVLRDSDKSYKIMNRFFRCVKQECLAFEIRFIEAAKNEKDGKNKLVPKVSHPVVYLEHEEEEEEEENNGSKSSSKQTFELNVDKLAECRVILAESIIVLARAVIVALTADDNTQQINPLEAVRYYSNKMKAAVKNGRNVMRLINKCKRPVYLSGDSRGLLLNFYSSLETLCINGIVVAREQSSSSMSLDDYDPFVVLFEWVRDTSETPASASASASAFTSANTNPIFPTFRYVNNLDAIIKESVLKGVNYALEVAFIEVPESRPGQKRQRENDVHPTTVKTTVLHSTKASLLDAIPEEAIRIANMFSCTMPQKSK